MSSIGILGAGTWGTALARMLCNSGNEVTVWSISAEEVESLSATRRHSNLPNCEIPEAIRFTNDIGETCENKDIVLFAVPSPYVRSTAAKAREHIPGKQIIVDVAKGIEADTLMTLTEVIRDEIQKDGKHDGVEIVALSGPTHAEEVAQDLPTTIVSACENLAVAEMIQNVFSNTCMRVYTNTDVKGVEICGALKNIIALAAGISAGLGYGDNTKAALITRGLAEIKRLGLSMGCREETFSGLAGMGDLIVTATSKHSRNNRCGYLIGQGYRPEDAIRQVGMVVEGVNALPAAKALAEKYNTEMPITQVVDAIIRGDASASDAVGMLMGRARKTEVQKPVMNTTLENALIRSPATKGDRKVKRVITYGTFDLLHYGHINLLRRAKALGDYLIVVVSTDEFNWNEKHKKCYFTYEQRKALVEAVRYVDLVIPEENWSQKRTDMHEYHIDTFVMGDDWKGKFDFLKEEGVEVVYLPRTPEISSSRIKKDLYDANAVDSENKTKHDLIDTEKK
ncbi:MAG: glycerol-3-phosphate cytidylyltransferase [Clostridia bacterium]|nr:glycerol-3-phosphate cytidylyltransferase [Clostridia bacterium]